MNRPFISPSYPVETDAQEIRTLLDWAKSRRQVAGNYTADALDDFIAALEAEAEQEAHDRADNAAAAYGDWVRDQNREDGLWL